MKILILSFILLVLAVLTGELLSTCLINPPERINDKVGEIHISAKPESLISPEELKVRVWGFTSNFRGSNLVIKSQLFSYTTELTSSIVTYDKTNNSFYFEITKTFQVSVTEDKLLSIYAQLIDNNIVYAQSFTEVSLLKNRPPDVSIYVISPRSDLDIIVGFPLQIEIGATVTDDKCGKIDPTIPILPEKCKFKYEWDINSSPEEFSADITTDFPKIKISYDKLGVFLIRLKVYDEVGNESFSKNQIPIYNLFPISNFSAYPAYGKVQDFKMFKVEGKNILLPIINAQIFYSEVAESISPKFNSLLQKQVKDFSIENKKVFASLENGEIIWSPFFLPDFLKENTSPIKKIISEELNFNIAVTYNSEEEFLCVFGTPVKLCFLSDYDNVNCLPMGIDAEDGFCTLENENKILILGMKGKHIKIYLISLGDLSVISDVQKTLSDVPIHVKFDQRRKILYGKLPRGIFATFVQDCLEGKNCIIEWEKVEEKNIQCYPPQTNWSQNIVDFSLLDFDFLIDKVVSMLMCYNVCLEGGCFSCVSSALTSFTLENNEFSRRISYACSDILSFTFPSSELAKYSNILNLGNGNFILWNQDSDVAIAETVEKPFYLSYNIKKSFSLGTFPTSLKILTEGGKDLLLVGQKGGSIKIFTLQNINLLLPIGIFPIMLDKHYFNNYYFVKSFGSSGNFVFVNLRKEEPVISGDYQRGIYMIKNFSSVKKIIEGDTEILGTGKKGNMFYLATSTQDGLLIISFDTEGEKAEEKIIGEIAEKVFFTDEKIIIASKNSIKTFSYSYEKISEKQIDGIKFFYKGKIFVFSGGNPYLYISILSPELEVEKSLSFLLMKDIKDVKITEISDEIFGTLEPVHSAILLLQDGRIFIIYIQMSEKELNLKPIAISLYRPVGDVISFDTSQYNRKNFIFLLSSLGDIYKVSLK